MRNHGRRWLAAAGLVALVLTASSVQAAGDGAGLILTCGSSCDSVAARVRAMGGTVTHSYRYIDALAVRVPNGRSVEVAGLRGVRAVYKDRLVAVPKPVEMAEVDVSGLVDVMPLDAAGLESYPANYTFNNILTGALAVHLSGNTGEGVLVAVIDSGTANNDMIVPALAGTVIGGESFVPLSQDPIASATSTLNYFHGTGVGSMIAAHAGFVFTNESTIVQSLNAHMPGSAVDCDLIGLCPSGLSVVNMFGTAPSANIYALKVFPSDGGGAPESRVIAAMERAIELRENFNMGMSTDPVNPGCGGEDDPCVYDALDIEIVNMSLGGPTLFAGRDEEDSLTQKMLEVGITLVVSAGNAGPAAITGGSPGTGMSSLTVGASSTPQHERVLRDAQFGLGIGAFYRPSDHIQTANFSSRGPTADGRHDPELSANGYASFIQGANGGLFFASGTSFSGPTVAGAAALLRHDYPGAPPGQIRNALFKTANPALIGDNSGRDDMGKGFLDILAAHDCLATDCVGSEIFPQAATHSVAMNIHSAGYAPIMFNGDHFEMSIADLAPGQVAHFFVPVSKATDEITINVSNIVPEDPNDQNIFFLDGVILHVVEAVTSSNTDETFEFLRDDFTLSRPNPQEGLMRVAVMGDWTNVGTVSADLSIDRTIGPLGPRTALGRLREGDTVPITVEVPDGVEELVFELHWTRDWARYPTNDLDMTVVSPSSDSNSDGASIASPERAVISSPEAGEWMVLIDAFTVFTEPDFHASGVEVFELRVTADGMPLQAEGSSSR